MQRVENPVAKMMLMSRRLKKRAIMRANRSPVKFPTVRGLLRHRAVFLIGNSPSLRMIPGLWEKLKSPTLITLGLNRVVERFYPDFWLVGDSDFTTQYGNYLTTDHTETFKGVKVFHPSAGMKCRLGANWVPYEVTKRGEAWGRHIDGLYHYPTSDLHALQLLHGDMEAETIFLLGVDHMEVDGKSHGFELTGLDQTKQSAIRDGKYDDVQGAMYQRLVEAGYVQAKKEARRTCRQIYTCSPVEDSMVKKHIPYMSFDRALEVADIAARSFHKPDLTELRGWRPFDGRYKRVIKP